MGQLFRKTYTMPVPPGAEITQLNGQRVARWRLRNGQLKSAEVVDCQDGKLRVRGQSKLYMARYRDGRGEVVEVATGCKDQVAARAVLTRLERRAELVRAGVMTPEENDAASHAALPLAKHLDAYERHLRAKGGSPRRIAMVRRRLERIARECRFARLNKMSAGPVERWLADQADAGLSAASRNVYRESLVCFGNWCRRTHRLTQNPFADLPRADQNADRRHQRRSPSPSCCGCSRRPSFGRSPSTVARSRRRRRRPRARVEAGPPGIESRWDSTTWTPRLIGRAMRSTTIRTSSPNWNGLGGNEN
jgi:hypothetical protein